MPLRGDDGWAFLIPEKTRTASFTEFFSEAEPRLRVALAAAFGVETGHDAAAEALAYGWENWDRVRGMDNPIGYLYRVGQSKGSRLVRPPRPLLPPAAAPEPWVESGLPAALSTLTEKQRVAVLLVHSLGWSQTEAAQLLGVSQGALRTHLQRGLKKLRRKLGVEDV